MQPPVSYDGCDEFIEVHLELVLAHSMIGSNQPLLEVSNRPIRKWDCGVRTFSQSRPKWLVPDDMFKSSLYKTGETFEPVRMDRGPRCDMLDKKRHSVVRDAGMEKRMSC